MTNPELLKILQDRELRARADFRVACARFYQTVRRGYQDDQKVLTAFDRYAKMWGIEDATTKLTNRILNYGLTRGHLLSKEGWTLQGPMLRRASAEARDDMPAHYQNVVEAHREWQAAHDAYVQEKDRKWWQCINPQPVPERHPEIEKQPATLPDYRNEAHVAAEHRPRLERVISVPPTRDQDLAPDAVPDRNGRPMWAETREEERERTKHEMQAYIREQERSR